MSTTIDAIDYVETDTHRHAVVELLIKPIEPDRCISWPILHVFNTKLVFYEHKAERDALSEGDCSNALL